MENKTIERTNRRLRSVFVSLWVLAVVLLLAFETGLLEEGAWAHDGQICYVWQTAGILLALCLIPFSLKMFGMMLKKRVLLLPKEEAVVSYRRWSEVRLFLLGVVVMFNLVVYYQTLSSIGGLCASLGLVASLFCWPSVERMKSELEL